MRSDWLKQHEYLAFGFEYNIAGSTPSTKWTNLGLTVNYREEAIMTTTISRKTAHEPAPSRASWSTNFTRAIGVPLPILGVARSLLVPCCPRSNA